MIQNQDEISLIMLLNKLQDAADFKELPDIREIAPDICRNTPEYLLEIIAKLTSILLYRLSLPEDEVDDMVGRIKERNMPELFEHFKGYDVPATRRDARREGMLEGIKEGKMSIIRNLLQKGMTESEIMELTECGQELIDEARSIRE